MKEVLPFKNAKFKTVGNPTKLILSLKEEIFSKLSNCAICGLFICDFACMRFRVFAIEK